MKSLLKTTNLIKLILATFLIISSPYIKSSSNDNNSEDSDSIEIYNLNDSNFESNVNNGLKNPWFIIFYVDSCPHCKNAKQTLSSIANNPDSISKSRIKLAQLDCDANMFTCYRFKISRVPYITIIDSNHMYELSEYPSKDNLVKFINMKKDADEGLEIPAAVGYLEFFFKSLEELVHLMNKTIEDYLKNNLGVKVEWRSEYTIGLLALVLVLIVVVEYAVLSFVCRRPGSKQKKPDVKDAKDVQDVKEEDAGDLKEIKEENVVEAKTEQQDTKDEVEKTQQDKKDD